MENEGIKRHYTEREPRESIWSVHPRYRIFYVILFLVLYAGIGSVAVDWKVASGEGLVSFLFRLDYDALATVGVVAATASFVVAEITEIVRVFYEAAREIIKRRQAEKERKDMARGAEKVIRDLEEQGLLIRKKGGKYVVHHDKDVTAARSVTRSG